MNDETPQSPLSGNSLPAPTPRPSKKISKNSLFLIGGALLVLGIIGGLIIWGSQQEQKVSRLNKEKTELEQKVKDGEAELDKRKTTTGEETINKDRYQAVFLKSGQVYFGKITKINESQVTLEDIYYLRVNGGGAMPKDPANPGDGQDISLVKLGNELHGPEDIMYIERKQIDFYENLKPDSQVSKAIEDYKSQNQPF